MLKLHLGCLLTSYRSFLCDSISNSCNGYEIPPRILPESLVGMPRGVYVEISTGIFLRILLVIFQGILLKLFKKFFLAMSVNKGLFLNFLQILNALVSGIPYRVLQKFLHRFLPVIPPGIPLGVSSVVFTEIAQWIYPEIALVSFPRIPTWTLSKVFPGYNLECPLEVLS